MGEHANLPSSVPRVHDKWMRDRIEGRMENVRYMSAAIDLADGIEGANLATDYDRRGFTQLMHLMTWGAGDTGIIYVALRRLQRAGEDDAFAVGLARLVETENEPERLASFATEMRLINRRYREGRAVLNRILG